MLSTNTFVFDDERNIEKFTVVAHYTSTLRIRRNAIKHLKHQPHDPLERGDMQLKETWTNSLLWILLCNICVGTCTLSAIVLKVPYMLPNSDREIKGRKEWLSLI